LKKDELASYRKKEVHVVGMTGAEGCAILHYLYNMGFTNLVGHDKGTGDLLRKSFNQSHISIPEGLREDNFKKLVSLPITFREGEDYLKGLETAELVFASQNWFAYPENAPLKFARSRGLPVRFLVQLYFDMTPCPIAAVTGTNGKTTVATLLTHILRSSGKNVLMSGNDRYHPQVLDKIDSLTHGDILVLEISNRQLMELDKGPALSILTNIRPDHIEEHGSFDAYIKVKEKLCINQKKTDISIINTDDPVARNVLSKCGGAAVPYALETISKNGAGYIHNQLGVRWKDKNHPLFSPEDLKIPGRHNLSNCLCAAAASWFMGSTAYQIQQAVSQFRGVRNRIQYLGEIEGIKYYDDLASTNPSATQAALQSFDSDVFLIVGGEFKGNESEYLDLKADLIARVKMIFSLGGNAGQAIVRAAEESVVSENVESVEEALVQIAKIAVPGDSVLLSPGGAGFYSRFIAGNKGYKHLVRNLRRKVRTTRLKHGNSKEYPC